MLAPDNYVQYPGSPSGYNRYQYANGNPLKYTDPSGDLSIGAWNSFWTFVGSGGGMNGGYISGSMGSVIEFGSSDQAFGYGITQVGNYDWWGAYSGYATSYKQALNRYNGGQTTPNIVTGYYRYEWRNTGRDNINAKYAEGVHKDQGYSVGWAGGYGTTDPTVGSMFVSHNKMESLLSGQQQKVGLDAAIKTTGVINDALGAAYSTTEALAGAGIIITNKLSKVSNVMNGINIVKNVPAIGVIGTVSDALDVGLDVYNGDYRKAALKSGVLILKNTIRFSSPIGFAVISLIDLGISAYDLYNEVNDD